MGGRNKGLEKLHHKPLVEHVIDRLKPQVDEILISANRDLEHYRQYGYPVYTDGKWADRGPMGGIVATGMHAANNLLLIAACDQPLLPANLFDRLLQAMGNYPLAVAVDQTGVQNLNLLMHRSVLASLQNQLEQGQYSLHRWLEKQPHGLAQFDQSSDSFANINTKEDLQQYEQ